MYYIAVDAMGGDYAPAEAIRGCADALNGREGFGLVVVGREDALYKELSSVSLNRDYLTEGRLAVRNASDVISSSDAPAAAIKEKRNSSMVSGLKLVSEGETQAFVSAGNTGALLAGGLMIIGRVKGVFRPALGVMLPSLTGYTFLIDAGANMDAKPQYLAQFAKMGSVYVENMSGIKNPRVGLINVGTEKDKGNALVKEAYSLLENAGINFTGNLEARDITLGGADVAVCDAFAGNIILKHSEGLSSAILSAIKNELPSEILSGETAAKAFSNIKKRFDSGEVGGAPFLGLRGLLVKAHGNSNARAFKNAIYQAADFIEKDTQNKLEKLLLTEE